ncbi:MAG: hypothetical protein ACJAZO_004193 [Myxococcota bacterium]|jgi:hypothetical protein
MRATIQHLILRLRIHFETGGRLRFGRRIKRRQDPEAERQIWRRLGIGVLQASRSSTVEHATAMTLIDNVAR